MRMIKRKILCILTLSLMCIFSLSACYKDTGSETSSYSVSMNSISDDTVEDDFEIISNRDMPKLCGTANFRPNVFRH